MLLQLTSCTRCNKCFEAPVIGLRVSDSLGEVHIATFDLILSHLECHCLLKAKEDRVEEGDACENEYHSHSIMHSHHCPTAAKHL